MHTRSCLKENPRVSAPLIERGHSRGARREGKKEKGGDRERVVVQAGVCEGGRGGMQGGFQRIWIEFNSGIRNNCMSSSCHRKPRQLCRRPPRPTANTLPSQAQEVMSQGRTPGLPLTSCRAGGRDGKSIVLLQWSTLGREMVYTTNGYGWTEEGKATCTT